VVCFFSLYSEIQELEAYDDFLVELLQKMHIGCSWDFMDDELWSKIMTVKPQPIDLSKYDDTTTEGHVRDIAPIVKHCFSTDDASVALKRLESEAKAFKVLEKGYNSFSKLDKKLAQDWFKFTRSVEKTNFQDTLAEEVKYFEGHK
jgi:hypothetical protein